MAQAVYHYPRGFLWGTATAAHQVEGNNTNNTWWAWEQTPGRILQGHKSGAACDWWAGRWREDLDRAADGGQNAHRFSIEWSRVQPTPDRWDEAALDRYRDILRGMKDRGLTPLVTLHHFSDPLWMAEKGGWENPDSPAWFERFVRKTVEACQEYANLWVTFNEPNLLLISGFILGIWPPGKQDLRLSGKVAANLGRAHAAAYQAIHQVQPTARAGIAYHIRLLQPARRWLPLDGLLAKFQAASLNEMFPALVHTGVLAHPLGRQQIPEARGAQDFIGINYYTRELLAFDLTRRADLFARRYFPPGSELSQTGFLANYPEGLFQTVKWATKFNLPILITENGVEDSTDALRPRYLIQHLHQLWRAVNFNFPVKGYFHWSLVDNFEWERGWTQRFGLWELDVETQARRKRPSADLYAEICRENGITSETAARYAPQIFEQLFPN